MRTLAFAWLIGLTGGLGCGLAGAFACDDHGDCVDGGLQGTCEADGWCSFPDDSCPSGQRYGTHAGGGLGGSCVDELGESSSGASTTGSGSITSSTTDAGDADGSTAGVDDTSTDGSTTGHPSTDGGSTDGTTTGSVTDATTDDSTTTSTSTSTSSTTNNGPECGNNLLEAGEDCEGPFMLGGGSCLQLGYSGGQLACNPDCTYNTGGCWQCGNNVVDPNEQCDGFDKPSCMDLGFNFGITVCTDMCIVDSSNCTF